MTRPPRGAATYELLAEIVSGGGGVTSESRLLRGALESFAALGFHRTTTRDIASRGQLSPAAVYIHYRSKEDLLHLIIRSTHEELIRQMREAVRGISSPMSRLKELVKAHVAFHARWYMAAKVANRELESLEPAHRDEIVHVRAKIEGLMESAVTAVASSAQREICDWKATNYAILSMGIGVSRWFRPDGRLSPEELGDLYAELVSRMFVPAADPAEEAPSASSPAVV